jgi:hypothetical protein
LFVIGSENKMNQQLNILCEYTEIAPTSRKRKIDSSQIVEKIDDVTNISVNEKDVFQSVLRERDNIITALKDKNEEFCKTISITENKFSNLQAVISK